MNLYLCLSIQEMQVIEQILATSVAQGSQSSYTVRIAFRRRFSCRKQGVNLKVILPWWFSPCLKLSHRSPDATADEIGRYLQDIVKK